MSDYYGIKKNYFRRNKYNILLLSAYLLFCYYSVSRGFIDTQYKDNSFHISLLTINTVFSGFLFTSLGIMVSIVDKSRIAALEKGGYMDNYYNSIYFGIVFHVLSAFISLLNIMFSYIRDVTLLLYIEQLALLGGVIFFIKSVYNIFRIVGKVRNSI